MRRVIPFLDLGRQYEALRTEIEPAVRRVLESGQFILGPEVAAFEEEFAAYCGGGEAMGVNSGTSALHLALLAAGVGAGDEVITTPFTFIATAAAISYTGATPVFVDIDPETFTIAPDKIEAAITDRTRAIIPVHLYGHPADMDPILELARKHRVTVIEDAAQAHGAEYKGRRVGSLGDLACFSFYPGKNLGAYGEAGAVVTRDPRAARMVRMLRDWGQERKYDHLLRGFNYRMEGLQGAILRIKLRHLEAWTEARRRRALVYDRLLAPLPYRTPMSRPDARHVFHVYAIRVQDRAALQRELAERGIQTGIHYPCPVHLQPAFAELGYRHGDFPEAEAAATEVLSLPMFAELSEEEQESVAAALSELVCAA